MKRILIVDDEPLIRSGLSKALKGLAVVETADAALRWFELAGEDGAWHPATAKIDGSEVIVSSDAVADPIAVRYACDTQPQGGNLYNRAGLPASPFCSKLEWLPWEMP